MLEQKRESFEIKQTITTHATRRILYFVLCRLQAEASPNTIKTHKTMSDAITNRLLSDWKLHIKFVDDTSAIEILPRNSISLLNSAATDIHQFVIDHNMRINPPKCKEMLINFMHYSNFSLSPIIIGNKVIERVSTYKILGVHVDCDLKWNTHLEYLCKKASKRLCCEC